MKMKLFIWKGVLFDYTDGVVFALAKNVEDARQVVLQSVEDWARKSVSEAMSGDPEVHEKPYGFALWGGG
jgi:CO dehydrogenase/acetyl-CoA synthase delta subunit